MNLTDLIGSGTGYIGTVTGPIGTQTTLRPSLKIGFNQSMLSPTHVECSSVFRSQETGTDKFPSIHAKFQQFFLLFSTSLANVAFSLVNLRNVFGLIASGVNTDASTWLLQSDLFRMYSQT